jgi:hypothetical protein
MNDLNKLNLHKKPLTIGALPSSYLASLTYEEQLLWLSKKTDEIISFINDILEQKISEYIEEKFNDIMLDSMYEAETETLVLYLTHEEG